MKKFFTHSIAICVAVFFFAATGFSQNAIWEEQFDGGLNGWTQEIISQSTDSLEWKWTDQQHVGTVLGGQNSANIMSPTAANGAAYVNFYLHRFGADDANIPPPPSTDYGEFVGYLVSPTLNFDTVTGPISIQFNQLARLLNARGGLGGNTIVGFSSDDGMTWTDLDANADLPTNDVANGQVNLPIPSNLGLQGSSTVKIRFGYGGDFYYWMVDDIQILERTNRDMQANVGWYAIAPNYSTPVSMVESIPFMVDIENRGGLDETGVNVNMTVRNLGNGAVAYEADQPYGTITADSVAENVVFGDFVPSADVALYRAEYRVSSDSTDSDMSNNSIVYNFEVSDGMFRKEDGVGLEDVAINGVTSWSMANAYYIPDGVNDFYVDYVTFGVGNADAISGQFVTLKLLKWEGDTDDSGTADPAEYTLEAFNGYTFDGSESGQILQIPVDLDGAAWPLEGGNHYIVVLEYVDNIGVAAQFMVSANFDYNPMIFATNLNGATRWGSFIDSENTGVLDDINFATYRTPALRMHVLDNVNSSNILSEDNKVSVFPNPTSDQLNIDLDLVEMSDVLEVKIADVSGKVMMNQRYENIQRDRISFDLRNYPTGSYLIHLTTSEGIKSLPFVVQH